MGLTFPSSSIPEGKPWMNVHFYVWKSDRRVIWKWGSSRPLGVWEILRVAVQEKGSLPTGSWCLFTDTCKCSGEHGGTSGMHRLWWRADLGLLPHSPYSPFSPPCLTQVTPSAGRILLFPLRKVWKKDNFLHFPLPSSPPACLERQHGTNCQQK